MMQCMKACVAVMCTLHSLLLAELCITSHIGGLSWQAAMVDAVDTGVLEQ